MALTDLFFANQQALTSDAGAFSTNVLAFGSARKLFGTGTPCRLCVEITSVTGTTMSLGVKLTAGDTSCTNNSAGDVLVDVNIPVIADQTLYEFPIAAQPTARKYMGVYFVTGGDTGGADGCTVNCYIAETSQKNQIA